MKSNFNKNIEQPFGWEPNDIIFNPNLSLKAKGLWLYMNAKPDGWFFASERIADECSDGITSVRAALKELANAGLLSWKKKGDGRVVYTLETVSFPQAGEPKSENLTLDADPKLENPTVGKPHSGKTSLINNKEEDKERIKERKSEAPAGSAGSGPAGRLPVRDKFTNDEEFERNFYERNTIRLGAI